MTSVSPILERWERIVRESGASSAIVDAGIGSSTTFEQIDEMALMFESRFFRDLPAGSLVIWRAPRFRPALAQCSAALIAALRRRIALLLVDSSSTDSQLESIRESSRAHRLVMSSASGELTGHSFQRHDAPHWAQTPPALLKLTSGTTGSPKFVPFTDHALLADATNVMRTMAFACGDINLSVIPCTHSYGLGNILLPLIAAGVPAIDCCDRTPRAILAAIELHSATVFPGTPVLFQSLAAIDGIARPRSLRLCISAGALLRKSTADAWRERFGKPLHSFYGSSECGGICYSRNPSPDDPEGFVGAPLDGVRLERARNGEAGYAQYAVVSEALGQGYWPESEDASFDGKRFISPDLLERTDTGEFIVRGRTTDRIEVGARKLDPRYVEMIIEKHTGVAWTAVFGVPSGSRGHDVVAAVVPSASATISEAELLGFVRRHCEAWQCPRDIWLLSEPPCNERGKLNRSELANRYREQVSKSLIQ
jgi:acyl-CoA synthetase (AMP-forming)/AMP-acid ligase II